MYYAANNRHRDNSDDDSGDVPTSHLHTSNADTDEKRANRLREIALVKAGKKEALYNGDLTSREAGSVGGQMVKKMIEDYENKIK